MTRKTPLGQKNVLVKKSVSSALKDSKRGKLWWVCPLLLPQTTTDRQLTRASSGLQWVTGSNLIRAFLPNAPGSNPNPRPIHCPDAGEPATLSSAAFIWLTGNRQVSLDQKRWFTEASEETWEKFIQTSSRTYFCYPCHSHKADLLRLKRWWELYHSIIWQGGRFFYCRISNGIHANWIHMVRKGKNLA